MDSLYIVFIRSQKRKINSMLFSILKSLQQKLSSDSSVLVLWANRQFPDLQHRPLSRIKTIKPNTDNSYGFPVFPM